MQRIRELIQEVRKQHPTDSFFDDFDKNLKSSRHFRTQYSAYNRAMLTLDVPSWDSLKHKALSHFAGLEPDGSQRTGQLKQDFFNQLNEVFAYEFLVRSGYTNVQFVPETNQKRPDIAYQNHLCQHFCEVKTIGISGAEIQRRQNLEANDYSVYLELSSNFLNKLNHDLTEALSQINSLGSTGLIYIIVRFDDFTLTHYTTYRAQLVEYLRLHSAPEVFIKIGINGRRKIHKRKLS
jgi:hypothetical protein